MTKRVFVFQFVIVGFLLGSFLGCSSKKSSDSSSGMITGKITYKGSPVTGGMMYLEPKAAGEGRVPVSIDGTGTYKGSVSVGGSFIVTIETESIKGLSGDGMATPKKGDLTKMPKMDVSKMSQGNPGFIPPKYVKIPAKYASPKTSGLVLEVKAGNQPQNFDLKD